MTKSDKIELTIFSSIAIGVVYLIYQYIQIIDNLIRGI